MLQYRILFFGADGELLYTGRMESEGDADALDRAAHLHHSHALELWEGDRCLRRFEPVEQRR